MPEMDAQVEAVQMTLAAAPSVQAAPAPCGTASSAPLSMANWAVAELNEMADSAEAVASALIALVSKGLAGLGLEEMLVLTGSALAAASVLLALEPEAVPVQRGLALEEG